MTVWPCARRNAVALSILLASTAAAADVVTDANAKAADFIAAAKLAHNGANYRAAAIVQVAVFEAVNAVTGRFPNARLKLDPRLYSPFPHSAQPCEISALSVRSHFGTGRGPHYLGIYVLRPLSSFARCQVIF